MTLTSAHSIIRFVDHEAIVLPLNHHVKTRTGSWGWGEHPTSPSVQQPHAEQRCVSVLLVYLTTVLWSRRYDILKPNTPCRQCLHCCCWTVLHSVSSWWQQIQICGAHMWLIAIPALCWEHPFIVLNTVWTHNQDVATDSEAPLPQRPARSLSLSVGQIMKCWHGPRALCFHAKLTCAVCWWRFLTARLHTCSSSKWPWSRATGVMFILEMKMIL